MLSLCLSELSVASGLFLCSSRPFLSLKQPNCGRFMWALNSSKALAAVFAHSLCAGIGHVQHVIRWGFFAFIPYSPLFFLLVFLLHVWLLTDVLSWIQVLRLPSFRILSETGSRLLPKRWVATYFLMCVTWRRFLQPPTLNAPIPQPVSTPLPIFLQKLIFDSHFSGPLTILIPARWWFLFPGVSSE